MKANMGVEVQPHSFLTMALDGGEWSASQPGHFTPSKEPLVATEQEAEWAPEPVWTLQRSKISYPLPGMKQQSISYPAQSLVSTLTVLFQLQQNSIM
jgi:hypothetical protein